MDEADTGPVQDASVQDGGEVPQHGIAGRGNMLHDHISTSM